MANFFMGLLRALRLPVRLVKGLVKRRKTKFNNQQERKQRAYVYNFSEGRLKNVSWQQSLGKDKKKKRKKIKNKKFSKKTNNFS